MKQITAWETSDGRLFLTEDAAETHERTKFMVWYAENVFTTDEGHIILGRDMITWLEDNREYLISFLRRH